MSPRFQQPDIEDKLEGQSFWKSERIIFLASLGTFLLFGWLLYLTQGHNTQLTQHSFLDAVFNSVSVGTLTGLFRGDSGFIALPGQFVLLLDMIVNGLIISVISVLLIIFIRLGFDRRESLKQGLHELGLHSKDILALILIDFALIWGLGTALLWVTGSHSLWEAAFNAASHILNDGVTALPGNMIGYRNSLAMLLSGAFLITIGGWGLSIRAAFYKFGLKRLGARRLAERIPESILVPKNFLIVIIATTAVLQLAGAGLFYCFEHANAHAFTAGTTTLTKVVDSYYMSVSSRTAGFTTIPDLSQLQDKTHFLLMLLMTIGASSGSFAGGVLKLTAFVYLLAYITSRIKGHFHIHTPHYRLHFSERTIMEANFRVIGFTTILFLIIITLFVVEARLSGQWLIFESISAVSNTGLSLGATSQLSASGMLLIMALMIVGKIGFITAVISFSPRYQALMEKADSNFDQLPVD